MTRPIDQTSADPEPLCRVVVQDVAAPWASYLELAGEVGPGSVPGLILHAAGATEDGYRTVEVWRALDLTPGRSNPVPAGLTVPPTTRTLIVLRLVTALADTTSDSSITRALATGHDTH